MQQLWCPLVDFVDQRMERQEPGGLFVGVNSEVVDPDCLLYQREQVTASAWNLGLMYMGTFRNVAFSSWFGLSSAHKLIFMYLKPKLYENSVFMYTGNQFLLGLDLLFTLLCLNLCDFFS